MGESFIEALIQGFKHDIQINSESKTLARKLPKIFTAPSFESVPQNSGTDFATDGDSKTKGPRLIQLIIKKKPIRNPHTPACFFEFQKIRIAFERED